MVDGPSVFEPTAPRSVVVGLPARSFSSSQDPIKVAMCFEGEATEFIERAATSLMRYILLTTSVKSFRYRSIVVCQKHDETMPCPRLHPASL